MSAVKLIFKRSSLLGKRPTNLNLEPGEIGLNTNETDPGLFFEVANGSVVKAGPTSVLPLPPTGSPAKGELWYNTQEGSLNIGDEIYNEKIWKKISAPYLGGSTDVVFVAPEFVGSTDSVLNDGRTLPFQTLTRAILELSKTHIQRVIAGATKSTENDRYTIYYAPSRVTANNGPGTPLEDFSVDFSNQGTRQPTIAQLEQFNADDGGIIIPAGISIVGMDLKKCEISPTYVPTYQNPAFPPRATDIDQPLSHVFKWAGNTYLNNFSVTDKVNTRDVEVVLPADGDNPDAVFRSTRPHGLSYNEKVTVTFTNNVERKNYTFTEGTYFVDPIDTFTFYLSPIDLTIDEAPTNFVEYSEVPGTLASGIKFIITNELYSAHRLSVFANVTEKELEDYYTKVQKAFPTQFKDVVSTGNSVVSAGEIIIVGPTGGRRPFTTAANTTTNSSAYLNQVNIRSQYGMCGGDFDGTVVLGFKSVIINSSTVVSLQNDPAAYEIYTTVINPVNNTPEQRWWSLPEATYYLIPPEERPLAIWLVPKEDQLTLLNSTPVENVRYYYRTTDTLSGENLGLTDINKDFRSYGFRFREKAFGQLQSVYTIGCAVGVWALNGGQIALTNSTSNFGSISFLSEAFYGINSIGGAVNNQKGFLLEGWQLPLALTYSQATSIENKQILTLGARVLGFTQDPDNVDVLRMHLTGRVNPGSLLPYSLAQGTAIWINYGENVYRAFLADDGLPTLILNTGDPDILSSVRIRASDSTIPTDPASIPYLGIPYIRRFRDPRTEFERSYSFVFRNTSPIAVSPSPFSVLRLNQSSDAVNYGSIRPNVQLDPGEQGGWGRVFSVAACENSSLATSPQFNYTLADSLQSDSYHVIITGADMSRPWNQALDDASGFGVTYDYKNWYAAENNNWYGVYYDATFEDDRGPLKVPPVDVNSPFVPTATIIRQESVEKTFQGAYGEDPDLPYYGDNATYLRGYTIPYTADGIQNFYNADDGTANMGLCNYDVYSGVSTQTTVKIDPDSRIQTELLPGTRRRYRPAIIQFDVLTPSVITNPKEGLSILKLVNSTETKFDYLRVISINGSTIQAIRLNPINSSYPQPTEDILDWPSGTTVQVMSLNTNPSPDAYDPNWGVTKKSLIRFLTIMGYPEVDVLPKLKPKYWDNRFLSVRSIGAFPRVDGYALDSVEWPCEFNTPSSIVANTHTWAYAGYYNYSIGLPVFQNASLPRKLTADFQSYSLWSGRLAVSGVNEDGQFYQFGPQFEATTSRYYQQPRPEINLPNQQIYENQTITTLPNQVVMFTADDFSESFDGMETIFALTRSGLAVPPAQLKTDSIVVQFNGKVLVPASDYYTSEGTIVFSEPPIDGATCRVRVVTSEDDDRTLTVVRHVFQEPADGSRTTFTVLHSEVNRVKVTQENTFMFINGDALAQSGDYTITRINPELIQFNLVRAPESGAVIDVRSFSSGAYWSTQGNHPVHVYNLDSLTGQFNGSAKDFTLTYLGSPVNPRLVTNQNLLLFLEGILLTPGEDYVIENTKILFTVAPPLGAFSILRVISNAEFLPSPSSLSTAAGFLEWGPSAVLEIANQTGIPV